MTAKTETEVTLLDVLEAFDRTPPTPGDEGVIDALASTGASTIKRLEAIWDAEDQGMLHDGQILMIDGPHSYFALSDLGTEVLEKLRFDERTRLTSHVARGLLGDIEAEMAGTK